MARQLLSILLGVALLWVGPLAAADKPGVFIDDFTSPELQAAIRAGTTTVIIPIGGTEQSGPHIALGKHNMRVRVLSEKIAIALGNAVVAPVLAYVPEGNIDPPAGHMRFAGTISIPADAYRKVLAGAARSFRVHGFRDVVFLGDHGDYQQDDAAVATLLNREWRGTPARAHAIAEYYQVPTAWFARTLQQRGFSPAEIGIHAGLADTSLTLALDPHMVRRDKLQPAPTVADGVRGDPQRSAAELGQLAVDEIVRQTVAAIRAATAIRR